MTNRIVTGQQLKNIPQIAATFYKKLANSRLRLVVKLFLVLVPLGFLIHNLYVNWQSLVELGVELNTSRFVFALLVLFFVFGLLPLSMKMVLTTLGSRLRYSAAYSGYYLSQLAKYLPGGIWIVPGRIVGLKRHGVAPVTSSLGTILELAILVLAGAAISLLLFLSYYSKPIIILTVAGLILLWVFLLLGVNSKKLEGFLKKWTNESDLVLKLRLQDLIRIIIIDLVFWVLVGVGFFLLIRSIYPLPLEVLPAVTGAFSAAWVIGFLAFLAPSGLGVREGALAIFLALFLPAPLPAFVALLARVWWTGADGLSVFLAWLWDVRLRAKS